MLVLLQQKSVLRAPHRVGGDRLHLTTLFMHTINCMYAMEAPQCLKLLEKWAAIKESQCQAELLAMDPWIRFSLFAA